LFRFKNDNNNNNYKKNKNLDEENITIWKEHQQEKKKYDKVF
jgi:hypothetical protein